VVLNVQPLALAWMALNGPVVDAVVVIGIGVPPINF